MSAGLVAQFLGAEILLSSSFCSNEQSAGFCESSFRFARLGAGTGYSWAIVT